MCGWQVNLYDPSLTRANLSALETSIAQIIKRYTNVLFTTYVVTKDNLRLVTSARYSFPGPLRAGGWVGLGGSVKYWGSLPAQKRLPIQYLPRRLGTELATIESQVQYPNHQTTESHASSCIEWMFTTKEPPYRRVQVFYTVHFSAWSR